MDIDTLIFILVFLAIVISNIKKILSERKKKKDDGKPEQPEKTDVLKKLLEKFVARIQEEINPIPSETSPRGKEPGRLSGWDAIVGEDQSLSASYDDQVESDYVPLELEEVEPEISNTPNATQERALKPELELQPEEKKDLERYPESATPMYPVSELRKAVIWSEILGPPVALRE